MANTTDMVITCFEEDDVIFSLFMKTGIDFKKVSDSEQCGGPKVVVFESYAACYRSLGKEKISEVIRAFKASLFFRPELAVLIIDDDNGDFSGVVTLDKDDLMVDTNIFYVPDTTL